MFKQSLVFSIPHSGEKIPRDLTPWLLNLPEEVIMCDVDRFVDELYEVYLAEHSLSFVKTPWHRYAGDLNRLPEDIDQDSVEGSENPSGKFTRGFHWVSTTKQFRLMNTPMSASVHKQLVDLISKPFHSSLSELHSRARKASGCVYHLDLHSMPSRGTSEHRDPGQDRVDVVISDQFGKSCSAPFRDLVISSFVQAGFTVGYNWPYYGGRITEQYGQPDQDIHVIQIELNRKIYMDEVSKQKIQKDFKKAQDQLRKALDYLLSRGEALRASKVL